MCAGVGACGHIYCIHKLVTCIALFFARNKSVYYDSSGKDTNSMQVEVCIHFIHSCLSLPPFPLPISSFQFFPVFMISSILQVLWSSTSYILFQPLWITIIRYIIYLCINVWSYFLTCSLLKTTISMSLLMTSLRGYRDWASPKRSCLFVLTTSSVLCWCSP